ncbi:MAG: hypothetical protein FWD17_01670 [Polyangiaceae bacterium]|nr:hypothetical protein [Polyangiaceae bacterium]
MIRGQEGDRRPFAHWDVIVWARRAGRCLLCGLPYYCGERVRACRTSGTRGFEDIHGASHENCEAVLRRATRPRR